MSETAVVRQCASCKKSKTVHVGNHGWLCKACIRADKYRKPAGRKR
jgi:hypothetical protein